MTIQIDTPSALDDVDETARRLLDSAAVLSYDPDEEVDWDAPLGADLYGLNPEWSTLFGTALWREMTEAQRVTLTRHEVASVMSTGIWFEMILQQLILREHYAGDTRSPAFRFALTEIADECRHSLMFARACDKLGAAGYLPTGRNLALGRFFKTVANGEQAYASILVAEEVLDVMQRDWMRGENVLPMVRTTSRIHVVEESRHMKFARHEVKAALGTAGPLRRRHSALLVAVAAHIIVTSMVNEGVYSAAGLDPVRAIAEARTNPHRKAMMRSSCAHLMDFLSEAGLLTKPAMAVYARADMI